MSTLSHNLYPTFVRSIPIRLPTMPYRWWAGIQASWKAHRMLRARQRVLEGMSKAALRDIGMEGRMPTTRHEAGIRLLKSVGPV